MQAIQLRGRMAQPERLREASAAAERVAGLVHQGDGPALDEADGVLIAAVHAGVRPTELFLAIVDAATREGP